LASFKKKKNSKTSIQLFRELFKEFRKQQGLKPVYYLSGDEPFFVDLLQDEVAGLVPDEQKDFNYDLIYGADSTPARVLDVARSYPMMGERRVVIIRNFLKLGEKTDDGDLGNFESYIQKPNPSTILCLIDTKLPDGRTALGKSIKNNPETCCVCKFDKVDDNRLPDWVIDWARHTHNKAMDPEAARVLAQMVGQDLQLLSTEIDKVCTFVDTRESVSIDDIKNISGSYREFSVLELKNAVLNRNLEQAFGIAEQMLQQSNHSTGEVLRTVGFFYNVFGNIWNICRLREQGLSRDQIQNELGSSPYIFNHQWREASQFRLSEMPQIFETLLDTDRALKGFSTLDTSSVFLLMLKRIIG
jgi:DNA polymerase III subunit delta